jgi:Spy/CpxP family protein refolding chaperone
MKKTFFIFGCVFTLLAGGNPTANSTQHYSSSYKGQEYREIKSLSNEDIDELQKGKGWGLAKAAELNGMPGPLHLLEMKEEIKLSEVQVSQIEQLYEKMKKEAIPLGLELIILEKKLNEAFADRTIDEKGLKSLLNQIANTYMALRYVHLSAHLKTPSILTPSQIETYNKLRGYFSDDPCKNIPKGHDPELWKKHHDCP